MFDRRILSIGRNLVSQGSSRWLPRLRLDSLLGGFVRSPSDSLPTRIPGRNASISSCVAPGARGRALVRQLLHESLEVRTVLASDLAAFSLPTNHEFGEVLTGNAFHSEAESASHGSLFAMDAALLGEGEADGPGMNSQAFSQNSNGQHSGNWDAALRTLFAVTDEDLTTYLDVRVDGSPVHGITVTTATSGLVNLMHFGPQAGLLQYTPLPDFYGVAEFGFTLTSGLHGTVTLNVQPVNDPPSFTVGPNHVVAEDAGPQSVVDFVTNISLGPENETDGEQRGPFGSPYNNQTGTFTVTTNRPELFTTLPAISPDGTLTYETAPNANGEALVSVFLTDTGGTARGGLNTSDTHTFTLTVLPVNDPPQGADKTLTLDEDTSITFTAADFGFSDPLDAASDSGANRFAAIMITSLELAGGNLRLRNTQVSVNQRISVEDLPELVYTPALNQHGLAVAAFAFKVIDDGGTARGGLDMALVANWIRFNVTSVNDAPTIDSSLSLTLPEDSGYTRFAGALVLGDVDAGDASVTVTLDVLHGRLRVGSADGVTVTGNNSRVVTVQGPIDAINALIAADGLYYRPDTNFNTVDPTSAGGTPPVERLRIVIDDHGASGVAPDPGSTAGLTATETVLITVTEVNDPPTSKVIQLVMNEDSSLTFHALALAEPGPAYERFAQQVFLVGNGSVLPQFGTVSFDLFNGLITYTPDPDYFGLDSFSYIITDNGTTAGQLDPRQLEITLTPVILPVNDAPVFANLVGGQTHFARRQPTIVAPQARITDVELDALGDYAGSFLVVERQGGRHPTDRFSLQPQGANPEFTIAGNRLQADGQTFGRMLATAGRLRIEFTSEQTAATPELVNAVLRSIAYTNTSRTPPAQVTLVYRFTDGTAADAETVTGTVVVNIQPEPAPRDLAFTVDEDSSLTGSLAAGNQIPDPAAVPLRFQFLTGPMDRMELDPVTGEFTFTATGLYDHLNVGQSEVVLYTYAILFDGLPLPGGGVAAGNRIGTLTITVTGVDDPAVITGDLTGTVVEAGGLANNIHGVPAATGNLWIEDVDNAWSLESFVARATPTAAEYGWYILTAAGFWTYLLDNADPRVEALGPGETLTDTFTVNTLVGAQQTVSITIQGTNDAPQAVQFSLPATVTEGQPARVTITGVTDVDSDQFTFNYVLLRDGIVQQSSGWTADTTFDLTPVGTVGQHTWTVQVQARDPFGAISPVQTETLNVVAQPATEGTLQVILIVQTPSGFVLRFNRSIDFALINLYAGRIAAGGTSAGAADVTLVGNATGAVRGSLVWDADYAGFEFIASGGVLQPDTYTIQLRSADDGFQDTAGQWLDGNGNQQPGGTYVRSFVVAATSARVVSMPDIVRGASSSEYQNLVVPYGNSQAGIPVSISDGAEIMAIDMDVVYDPEMMQITSVARGEDASGWTYSVQLLASGRVRISAFGENALGNGNREFLRLLGHVTPGAPYGQSQVVRIEHLAAYTIDSDQPVPTLADRAVHKALYIGDVDASGHYSDQDADWIEEVIDGLFSGFGEFPLTDPLILGDVSRNHWLDATDVQWIRQKASSPESRPEIPDVAAGAWWAALGAEPVTKRPWWEG
jgi:VCBS repeat-containing protein